MDGFSLENRATRNMATNARETNADILRNRTQRAAVCRYCSSSSKIVTSSASQKRAALLARAAARLAKSRAQVAQQQF